METCFTPNHLLFGRQLLYSSNTTSTVVRNLTVLSSTTNKINRISNHFLDRWRHGYVVNLRETQRTSKLNINSLKINVNDIVLDSEIRGAIVRIVKINKILKRPVNKLFALENTYHDTNQTDKAKEQSLGFYKS